ncbi:MAG: VCBS repeat-containing protein [Planctomycetes bacterium]|nr:VCBS repeat-containing protein [Planctomycetota bacterium]
MKRNLAIAVAVGAGLSLEMANSNGGEVPTFTDETSVRLVAVPQNGSEDTKEKDFGLGDFDQDGDIDIAIGRRIALDNNTGQGARNTLLMNVDGVLTEQTIEFAPAMLTITRTRDVLVADFNVDGWPDLLFADGPNAAPMLLLNMGESDGDWLGFATAPAMLPFGFNVDAWSLSAGDLINDDDAYLDVFVGVRTGNDRILVNLGDDGGIWQGFADESFRLGANANTPAVRSSAIYDLNGDGDADIVEGVTCCGGTVRILANNGSGMFTASPQTVITGAAYNFGLGDLDGNGDLDFFGVRNSLDQYRLNLGAGANDTVALGTLYTAPSSSSGWGSIVRSADLDANGFDDFLICDMDQEFPQDCSRRLNIYFSSGVAPFLSDGYPVQQAWTPNGTSDVGLLDLDGDGDLDMFIGHCTGNSVFTQDGAALAIISSDPPDGAIDARQPSEPDGSNEAGWDGIDLTFGSDASGVSVDDFTIESDPDPDAAPVIDSIEIDGNTAALAFSSIIPVKNWTIVTHVASGTSARIGYLPGDVNNDGLSNANDVLALIDILNGVVDPPPEYQTDTDRSGQTNPSDVLRVIDLLNGAGVYEAFNGASLPD